MGIGPRSKSTVSGIADGSSGCVDRGVRNWGVRHWDVRHWSRRSMGSRSNPFNDGVETVNVIGDVLNHSEGAVGLGHGVGALDDVSVAVLGLGLVVASVGVSYSVIVGVFGVSLVLIELLFIRLLIHSTDIK